ncbi:MAG TPA: DUF1259 domain-containing protein [Gemmatimonadales bacterium]|nr:DUF1259 domain-containing protein [Gemmatimonadales bacterium]
MPRLRIASLILCTVAAPRVARAQDWKAVDQALGRAGAMQPGDVYKFGFPRSDLHVTVGGVSIKPSLALGSWVAFKQGTDGQVTLMGDLVLTEHEVEPVMQTLQAGGVEQTAVHNHLLGESPHVFYMHIMGHGDAATLAASVHAALALTGTPPASAPVPAPALALDTATLSKTLGFAGKVAGGVYQVGVARLDTVQVDGMVVPPSMGVATALNFQPTGEGKAAITGDFVLIGSEVNPVLRALRSNGIEVTALHGHMLSETPRLFFMHFWAHGDAGKLAKGLREALDHMNVKKS